MKSYVINLDRNPERLAAMSGRFAALGLAFERVPAIDARALSRAEIAEFQRCRPGVPWVYAGQIGCFQSHLAAWKLVAEGAEPYAAIFEDDVHVSDDLPLHLADPAPPLEVDILRLEVSTNRMLLHAPFRRTSGGAVWHGRAVRRVRSTTWCAGGYVISRRAAAHLAGLPEEAHQPVDYLLFCFETSAVARGLDIQQLVPALCIQDKFLHADTGLIRFRSEIEPGQREAWTERLAFCARNAGPAVWKTLAGYQRVQFG